MIAWTLAHNRDGIEITGCIADVVTLIEQQGVIIQQKDLEFITSLSEQLLDSVCWEHLPAGPCFSSIKNISSWNGRIEDLITVERDTRIKHTEEKYLQRTRKSGEKLADKIEDHKPIVSLNSYFDKVKKEEIKIELLENRIYSKIYLSSISRYLELKDFVKTWKPSKKRRSVMMKVGSGIDVNGVNTLMLHKGLIIYIQKGILKRKIRDIFPFPIFTTNELKTSTKEEVKLWLEKGLIVLTHNPYFIDRTMPSIAVLGNRLTNPWLFDNSSAWRKNRYLDYHQCEARVYLILHDGLQVKHALNVIRHDYKIAPIS